MYNETDIYFSDCIEFFKSKAFDNEWITVYELFSSRNQKLSTYSALVQTLFVPDKIKQSRWDLTKPGHPSSVVSTFKNGIEKYWYESYAHGSEVQPLIFVRHIPDEDLYYPEICEEFRLYFDTFQDKRDKNFYCYDDEGRKLLIAKYSEQKVQLSYKFLWEFISVKQVSLSVFSEIKRYYSDPQDFTDYESLEVGEYYVIDRWKPNYEQTDKFCMFRGKSYLLPIKSEQIYTFFERNKKYEEFIIGKDKLGNPILHTCNPLKLKDYTGNKNPDAPFVLKPVFFKKEVLKKYYDNNEKYEIHDSNLSRIGYWNLHIDNNCSDYIGVYLVDLGQSLPYEEQVYWKSFTILPENAKLSSVYFKRSILGQFTDCTASDLRLKNVTIEFSKFWKNYFGWDLFLPFTKEDEYHLTSIRLPLNNSQKEFDELIQFIAKTFNDSINIKELNSNIPTSDLEKLTKEQRSQKITMLEAFLSSISYKRYSEFGQLLRNIQSVRSTGIAHRKGSKYEKAIKKFQIDFNDLTKSFNKIYNQFIVFFDSIMIHLSEIQSLE